MVCNPKKGDLFVIWYRKSNRHLPYHGCVCKILIPGKGKPRNHLVETFIGKVIIPSGNLRVDYPIKYKLDNK